MREVNNDENINTTLYERNMRSANSIKLVECYVWKGKVRETCRMQCEERKGERNLQNAM